MNINTIFCGSVYSPAQPPTTKPTRAESVAMAVSPAEQRLKKLADRLLQLWPTSEPFLSLDDRLYLDGLDVKMALFCGVYGNGRLFSPTRNLDHTMLVCKKLSDKYKDCKLSLRTCFKKGKRLFKLNLLEPTEHWYHNYSFITHSGKWCSTPAVAICTTALKFRAKL